LWQFNDRFGIINPMKITGKTKLLGVIGDPIGHSLSPVMHNATLAAMQLDYVYVPFGIKAESLATAIAGFEAIGVVGFNVTIPHKQLIIPCLTHISALAQTVGAVNTVWQTAAGWQGTNTDVEGFVAPLKALDRDWSHTNVVCLGNGGAARAIVTGCLQLGCNPIQIVGRNVEKLQHFQASWPGANSQFTVHTWDALPELLPQADLIVNTTPIGMLPHGQDSPLSDTEAALIQPGAIAYDLIYVPNPTRFLQQAQTQGAMAIDGLEMLIQQGAAALRIWTNQDVPVAVMRQALRQHLGI
jgi:shikimate dehydrogenase